MSFVLPHPQVDGEQPATEREGEEDVPGEPGEQGGNQDLWDSLLPALPQQWHQALNLLRVRVAVGKGSVEGWGVVVRSGRGVWRVEGECGE